MTSRSSGQVSVIKQKTPMEGNRTLDFFMTGDGTSNEHKRVMMEKGVDYATAIINITLQRGECNMAYGAYYMPILANGTPAITLSYKECEDVQRPVVAMILPKMGIVRNSARKVVFGSAKYCGLGLDHLATVQNISRLQYLIGHIRSKSITSKLICQQLYYTQLEIGCPSQVLGQDYKRYSQASNMGIITRMQGISHRKIRLDPAAGKNWRRNDHGSIDGINTCEKNRFCSDWQMSHLPSGLIPFIYREYPR
jgi:hypothetical protein